MTRAVKWFGIALLALWCLRADAAFLLAGTYKPTSFLLLEDGSFLLLEDGSKLILE